VEHRRKNGLKKLASALDHAGNRPALKTFLLLKVQRITLPKIQVQPIKGILEARRGHKKKNWGK